jgi:hypothetical protein
MEAAWEPAMRAAATRKRLEDCILTLCVGLVCEQRGENLEMGLRFQCRWYEDIIGRMISVLDGSRASLEDEDEVVQT